jgi:expansin (peptidoglycan-binding protein)
MHPTMSAEWWVLLQSSNHRGPIVRVDLKKRKKHWEKALEKREKKGKVKKYFGNFNFPQT